MKTRMLSAFAVATALATPLHAAPEIAAIYDVAPDGFVKTVASSNAFEIRSSELAEQKATRPALKEFAAQMVADHRKAAEGLAAAAGEIPVPQEMAPKHVAMVALLENAEGAEFDMLYADMQAGAHAEAVSLFTLFSQNGTDPELMEFAATTLPTLEAHKDHIDGIVAKP